MHAVVARAWYIRYMRLGRPTTQASNFHWSLQLGEDEILGSTISENGSACMEGEVEVRIRWWQG